LSALRGTGLALLLTALLAACGGGGGNSIATSSSSSSGSSSGSSSSGSGGTVNNVQSVSVNFGPNGNYVNGIFTSVTICAPGSTSACQTIGNILVDTGSYGLRILDTALDSTMTNALTAQTSTSGGKVGECVVYGDGYTWGPVTTVDLQITGETASSMPINIFGAANTFTNNFAGFPGVPSACSSGAGSEEDTLSSFGANGVLGIGPFPEDCGGSCQTNANNGLYYSCNSLTCTGTTEAVTSQVPNPISYFAGDNNGVIVELPSISAGGATTVSGSLIFGIGTQSNNTLGSAQVLTVNDSAEFSTNFNNTSGIPAFIDSGSNALYFNDSSITQCTGGNAGFYCPATTESFTGVMVGENSASVTVPFSVANTNNLSGNNAAFNDLAGSASVLSNGSSTNGYFDWGLPFFFGRNVYFAIYGDSVSGTSTIGPFYAF